MVEKLWNADVIWFGFLKAYFGGNLWCPKYSWVRCDVLEFLMFQPSLVMMMHPYHSIVKDNAQELLKFKTKGGSVDVRQLLPGPGNDYRCVKKNGNRICSLDSCFGL